MGRVKKDWFTWAHPILIGGQDVKSATSFAAMRVLQPLMGNNRYDRQSSTIPIMPGLGDIHHASLHQEQFAWYVNKSKGCPYKAKAYTIIAPIRYTQDIFFRDGAGRSTGFPLYYGIGAKVDVCKLWETIKRQTHQKQVDLIDSTQIQNGVKSLLQQGRLDDYYLIYMASYVKPQLFDLYIRNEHYPWASGSQFYICHWDNWDTLRRQLQLQGIVKKFVIEAHKKYPLKNYIAKYKTKEYTNYWDNPAFQAAMNGIEAIWLSRFKLRIWMKQIYKQHP